MATRDYGKAAGAVARLVGRIFGVEAVVESGKDLLDLKSALKRSDAGTDLTKVVDGVRQTLGRLLEVEFRTTPDNDVEAALLELEALFDQQPATPLMLEAVKDSAALERFLMHEAGGWRHKHRLRSTDAARVFDRVLEHSCRYLAEVSLTKPEFVPAALQDLLRSERELRAITDAILAAVRPPSGVDDSEFVAYTRRYLSRVNEQLNFVDLPGLDLERRRARYSLSASYIPLSAQSKDSVTSTEIANLDAFLDLHPFTLVVGEPGAGKSTLLKWAAIQYAADAGKEPSSWRIPILVKLRSFKSMPSMDDLGDPLARGLARRRPQGWPRDLIEVGHALLLLDGLDEIEEPLREAWVRWASEVFAENKDRGLKIVVTSRHAAVTDPRFVPGGAHIVRLRPMSQVHIERFVYAWHSAVFQPLTTDDRESVSATADQLLARFDASPELSRIAANPLLCAVICALYYARSKTLPSERAELYDAILDMLFKRRDSERDGIPANLSLSQTERLVEGVAEVFLRRAVDEWPRAEVLKVIEKSMSRFRDRDVRGLRPGLALDEIVLRTNVLRELPQGAIDFWHKSFQEYLAARAIVAEGNDDDWRKNITSSAWREALIWASSFMSMERASALILFVIDAAGHDRNRPAATYLKTLALAMAHQATQLTDAAHEAVLRVAQAMIPPKSQQEVAAVTELRDAAVPYLEDVLRDPSTSSDAYQRTVAALLRIGGEASNSALAAMPDSAKVRWLRYLVEGWSATGSRDYVRRVLRPIPIPAGESIAVNVSSRRALMSIGELPEGGYRVRLTLRPEVVDLSSELAAHIKVASAHLQRFDWDEACKVLRRYQPAALRIDDPGPIVRQATATAEAVRFNQVRSLYLTYRTATQSDRLELDSLAVFPNLESLVVEGPVEVVASTGFSFASSIRNVVFYDVDSSLIAWDGPIASLHCFPWPSSDLEKLTGLKQLEELSLPSSSLTTLTGLADLPVLGFLDVSESIWLSDVSAVQDAQSLEMVVVEGCRSLQQEPFDEALSGLVQVPDDALGQYQGEDGLLPILVERWSYPDLGRVGEEELRARGWDDWSALVAFTDEYPPFGAQADPHDYSQLQDEGLTLHPDFERWSQRLEASEGIDPGDPGSEDLDYNGVRDPAPPLEPRIGIPFAHLDGRVSLVLGQKGTGAVSGGSLLPDGEAPQVDLSDADMP